MAQVATLKKLSLSPYEGDTFLMITKHAKSAPVRPPFSTMLGAGVIEYGLDTDRLGTFTGEVERPADAVECARRKCAWGLERLQDADLALASEGSFGPHPVVPFIPVNTEIMYCIDRKRDFECHVAIVSDKTNYRTRQIDSVEDLRKFAEAALFPSHGLIVRPNVWKDKSIIFKGIDTEDGLLHAFEESRRHSADGKVWVETDMRAHMNPTRMEVIGELAETMARRLATCCPRCETPGWGRVRTEPGLPCSDCGADTPQAKLHVNGCTHCGNEHSFPRTDGKVVADPAHCMYCNP